MATTGINYKQLREGLSFQDILTHYNVTLRTKGDQWHVCPLPTHDGMRRSPSFSANIAKGIWHCFGCGAKGNALEFIARMEVQPGRQSRVSESGAVRTKNIYRR